ncbi:MAG: energy-coupling factor transporter transmembrane protein EcfT [Bacilli bacterium]|nr:energy-coupling factor transporter transmembrane protein EcfT [Bacilli bacterium]
MNNFALGKYVPYDTWVHRLDARVKIIAVIMLMVAVFFPLSTWSMTLLVQGTLLVLISVILACTKTPLHSILTSLRSLWVMVLFLLLIYILVPKAENTLGIAWSVNGWTVYWDSFAEAARIVVRLVMMIMLAMALTSSTKPLDLTYALQWYFTPLKVIRFPAEEFAMTISIALRFIPTLLEDALRVMRAQSSRGVDFAHGRLSKRIVGLTSLIVPLFVSSFIRSEELANAMECRCYDPRGKRTRYRKLRFHWGDLVAFLFAGAVMAGVIVLSALHVDLFALMGIVAL